MAKWTAAVSADVTHLPHVPEFGGQCYSPGIQE
jgi:hypothetical protein